MSSQLHTENVVVFWRVGVLDRDGTVSSVYSIDRTNEASSRAFAANISKFPYVWETWIRPVMITGEIGQPVAYFRDGKQVS